MFEPPTPPLSRGPSSDWIATYVKSVHGILKIVEVIMSLVGLICAAVFHAQWYKGFGFVTFVFVTGFIHSALSLALHVLNFFPDMTLAYIIEMVVYAVYTLFFFIALIISAVVADVATNSPETGAAAFFAIVCLLLWGFDTFIQFMAWRSKGSQPPTASNNPPPKTTTTDAPTY